MLRRAIALSPLVGTWFQVLFHSPNRGAFNFSVALLCTIGRQGILSLTGWAPQIHTAFHGNRATQEILGSERAFAYGAITLYGWLSSPVPLTRSFVTSRVLRRHPKGLLQPPPHNDYGLTCHGFRLFRVRSPLLTESRFSFYSCRYLDVSVPCVRFRALCIQARTTRHDPGRVSPFGHLGVNGWLAPRPSLSQLPHVLHRFLTPKHPRT